MVIREATHRESVVHIFTSRHSLYCLLAYKSYSSGPEHNTYQLLLFTWRHSLFCSLEYKSYSSGHERIMWLGKHLTSLNIQSLVTTVGWSQLVASFRLMCTDGVAGLEVPLLKQKILARIWEKVFRIAFTKCNHVRHMTCNQIWHILWKFWCQIVNCGRSGLAWGTKCHYTARDQGYWYYQSKASQLFMILDSI